MKLLSSLCALLAVVTISCAQERPIKVIIPAYNNAAYVKATLESVFQQSYSNYYVIYIDDCSTDGSCQKAESIIAQSNKSNQVKVIRNDTRHRKLKNIFYAIHWLCDDDDIVVMVDCDDILVGKGVFQHINRMYSDDNVWLTYGQDKPFPEDVARKWGLPLKGNCCATPDHVIAANNFRSYDFVYMHLRTFKAWLFKAIAVDDLLAINVPNYRGQFYPACNDYAMYYPMLEMAGRHIRFNPTLVYLYNCGSPLNGFKIDRTLQTMSAKEIRHMRKKYTPLAQPFKTTPVDADHDLHIVVLSSSTDQTLSWISQAVPSSFTGDLTVIAPSTEQAAQLSAAGIAAVRMDESMESLGRLPSFLCISRDTNVPEHPLELDHILTSLNMTHAYGYLWGINASHMTHQEISSDLRVAQLGVNHNLSNHLKDGVYRTQDVINSSLSEHASYAHMLHLWQNSRCDPLRTVLFN